jgi:glycosyltransferase involved in cell wall biosynthesis
LYRHALCLIYPSFAEGYGSPVAEALCSGVPVVTSSQSPMADIGKEAVALADPLSVSEIANAVLRIISSEQDHSVWKRRARERGGELRAQRKTDELISIYAGLARS